MSGININVVPRTLFKFDSVLANSAVFNVPIARYIDISRYREITGVVRVHQRSITGTSGKISVALLSDVPTAQDPANDFNPPTGPQVTLDIIGTTVAPSVSLIAFPANGGPMIAVWLQVLAGTTNGALQAMISVDISMKS
jgi:hypothetical protein